jgi:tRNA dimethylallyltransferase
VLAIVGPTATGKTELAIRVAEAWGAEIVSCDSMQIYRGLDIGTAKPTAAEQARAPHHLLDVVEPDESFSAARYVELADRAIAEVTARERPVVICGGTGLYLRALRWGLFDAPPRDCTLREQLYEDEKREPGVLHERLRKVDAPSAGRIAPRDLVRLVRALEVHALTGTAISEHHATQEVKARHVMRVAVLDPPKAITDERIAARSAQLVAAGLVDETRRVRARFGPTIAPLQAVGYREAGQFLDGALPEGELVAAITRATRRYARRQRTWFRKERDVVRYETGEVLYGAEIGLR